MIYFIFVIAIYVNGESLQPSLLTSTNQTGVEITKCEHQLESLQATIDNELRTKSELQKGRIFELESLQARILDLSYKKQSLMRNNFELQKTIKKLHAQMKAYEIKLQKLQKLQNLRVDSRAIELAVQKKERRAIELAVQLDEARAAFEDCDSKQKYN